MKGDGPDGTHTVKLQSICILKQSYPAKPQTNEQKQKQQKKVN